VLAESAADDLRQNIKVLEDALSVSVLRFNSTENSKMSLEHKMKQYEEQIQRMDASIVSIFISTLPLFLSWPYFAILALRDAPDAFIRRRNGQ
jgi:hypothetical protein